MTTATTAEVSTVPEEAISDALFIVGRTDVPHLYRDPVTGRVWLAVNSRARVSLSMDLDQLRDLVSQGQRVLLAAEVTA